MSTRRPDRMSNLDDYDDYVYYRRNGIIYKGESYYSPVFPESDDTKPNSSIDINRVVEVLPKEIIIKIYNDYFRPVKFYQLYTHIMTNPLSNSASLHDSNKEQFKIHLQIFLYENIGKYIRKKDPVFNLVMNDLKDRNYTSAFVLIPQLKNSLFLELLMYKYH